MLSVSGTGSTSCDGIYQLERGIECHNQPIYISLTYLDGIEKVGLNVGLQGNDKYWFCNNKHHTVVCFYAGYVETKKMRMFAPDFPWNVACLD